MVLDSDDKLFGGFNRIDHTAEYFSTVRLSLIGWFFVNSEDFSRMAFSIVFGHAGRVIRQQASLFLGVCAKSNCGSLCSF